MRVHVMFLVCLATVSSWAIDYPSWPPEKTISAHDPSVFKDQSFFYIYGTHNMPVWRSRDLIKFDQVELRLVRDLPDEAKEHAGEGGRMLWAPDMVKVGNEYRLYYCLSRFGSSQSYIGYLVGKSPTGTFKDGAEVIRSTDPREDRGGPNALDPSILTDDDGRQRMIYGSFFSGIHVLRLG